MRAQMLRTMRGSMSIRLSSLLALTLVAACSDPEPGGGAPTAPSALTVVALSGGAHMTWVDNSNDEDDFAIMRMEVGTDAALREIDSVPFNTTQYHDAPVTTGATYKYKIVATNASGETATAEVMFVAP